MRKVSKEEFFAKVGPLDVHPRVDVRTLRGRHHVSNWEHQKTRKPFGVTRSDSWGIEGTEFYLAGEPAPASSGGLIPDHGGDS